MNTNSQLAIHPNAETLNAFVEQALAEQERGQILVHLAGCSRCRQVVYLAQEAAVEMEPAVAAPAANAAIRSDSWFRSWRFAWVPAAALASVVALAFLIHVRRTEVSSELAKVTPQAAPQANSPNEMATSAPSTQPLAMKAAPPPAFAVSAPTSPHNPTAESPSAESRQLSLAAAQSSAAGTNEAANASSENAALSGGASGSDYSALGAAPESKQQPATAAWQHDQQRAATASQVHTYAAKEMAQANANQSQKPEPTVPILTSAPPLFDASPAPSASYEVSARHGAAAGLDAYKAKPVELPSGLPTVSTAAAQHFMLAIDQAGTVFLSQDSGGRWNLVARQWTGRALTVRIQAVAAKAKKSSAASSPGSVFEIVNDQGEVWISTDGRIWKAK
jgi:hypothetical protein